MCDKLTSSMPFINPFGSLSISMFGFLFIFNKRSSISRTNPSLSPAAVRPLLDYSRVTSLAAAIFTLTHSYFGLSPAGIRGSRVTSRVRSRANMKVAVQSRRAKIKRVFLTLDSSVLVAYGGHSVWSSDNHVLLRGREVRSPPGDWVNRWWRSRWWKAFLGSGCGGG